MPCPNCDDPMMPAVVDKQSILHCKNCGGTFFEENGINRITAEDAEKLADDKKTLLVVDNEKLCPKDHLLLSLVKGDEAIPQTVHLFKCAACKGIFVYPDDLIHFKRAQSAKVNYFKLWDIPLPSVRAVVIASFTIFVSLALFTTFLTYQRGTATPTQAENVVKNLNISQSGRYIFISFRTQSPYQSRISFFDRTTSQEFTKTISDTPKTLHYLTTSDLDPNHEIYYRITLKTSTQEFVAKEGKLEVAQR